MMHRKLGFWESTCKFAHDFFAGTSNIIARANFTGVVNIDLAKKILTILFNKHPLLRAVIRENNREFFFYINADCAAIPISVNKKNLSDEWQEIVEEEMRKKFPIDKYLCRATLLYSAQNNQHELIIAFHHAIADGLSVATIIRDFFAYYASAEKGESLVLNELPFLPAIESMLTSKNNWSEFLKNKKAIKDETEDQWKYHNFKPLEQRYMRNIYCEIDTGRLEKLQYQCRFENTTINAMLNAVMLISAQQIQNSKINTSLHTPINLRNYCQSIIIPEQVGCYISMVKTIHQEITSETPLWLLAKAYRQQLNTMIPKTGMCPDNFLLANFDIAEITELFDLPGSTKRRYFSAGYAVTNIGVIHFKNSYGSLKLNDFMFCTNHVMGNYVIFLNVLTMFNKMKFCFSYAEPLIETEWAREFVINFINILNRMTE